MTTADSVPRCIQCGGLVPRREKPASGSQPGFCSSACRQTRRVLMLQRWRTTKLDRSREAERRKKYKEKRPDYFREHYARNKEKRKAESLAWYHSNAERAAKRQKAYFEKRRQQKPELVRALGRRSTAKRRAIEKSVFVEVVDPRTVFKRDEGICGICREPVDIASAWEVDHVVPISKGGDHAYANVQLAHRSCNRSKGARVVLSA